MNRRQWLVATAAMLSTGALSSLRAASAKAADTPRGTVYLATYSHIDAAWLWPLQEGEQQADAVFRSVLDRLTEFPALRFSESSASYYAWIRASDPQTFARLTAAVAARHWEPLGGWWTEADTNVPSGETLMRQGFYGQAEFEASFGAGSAVAFLPDSFGSSANLPAILAAQGFDTFVLGRGSFVDGTSLPEGRFVWRGLGEAEIVAYNNPVPGGMDDAIATVRAALAVGAAEPPLVWFGLGDHGGGPSKAALEALSAQLAGPNPPDVRFSRFDDYFAGKPRPTISRAGELQHVFAGAYANAAEIKRSNYDAQRSLVDAERFDLMAALLAHKQSLPSGVGDLWRTLLINQHHDTISGTAIRASLEAAVEANRAVIARADAMVAADLEGIVDRIDHRDPADQMVAVFNPLPQGVHTPVSYDFDAGIDPSRSGYEAFAAANQLLAADDSDVAAQPATADADDLPGSLRRVSFIADLPPFGYATFRLRRVKREPPPPRSSNELELDNDVLRVVIDALTGQPASVVNAADGQRLLPAPIRLVVFKDDANTWGDPQIGVARSEELGAFRAQCVAAVERGSVRQVIRSWSTFADSTAIQDWILYAGESQLRTVVRARWETTRARLALSVPHDVSQGVALYDIPFGRIERPLDDLVHPASSFVCVGSGPEALAVITAGSHALWASPRDIGATLLRSAPYASMSAAHDPLSVEDAQDTGEHEIRAAVAFGAGDPRRLAQSAEELAREFPVQWVGVHSGELNSAPMIMDVDPGVGVASSRRVGVDELIVRLHDETGTSHASWITLGQRRWVGTIDAFGIVTLAVSRDAIKVTDAI